MTEFIETTLDVAGTNVGEVLTGVTVYLPFADATFAAQQQVKGEGLWVVVHVPTTGLVPPTRAAFETRDEAVKTARKLSYGCPAAAHVSLGSDHKMIGPFALMRQQILECLGSSS